LLFERPHDGSKLDLISLSIFTRIPIDAARKYAAGRLHYPQRLIDDLGERTAGDHGERLVDWGCGTGELTLHLSLLFDRVTAIDSAPAMITIAQEKARCMEIENIEWLAGRAEDLEIEPQSCDLITAGTAFHWMDRELLANRAFDALKPGAALALAGGGARRPKEGAAGWRELADECLRNHISARRQASRKHGVAKTDSDILSPLGFRIERFDYPVDHSWRVDDIVAFMYSTAPVLVTLEDDKREAFEYELRDVLTRANPSGVFHETLAFFLMIAYRP
jgi:trans-aconitate methyltransferase